MQSYEKLLNLNNYITVLYYTENEVSGGIMRENIPRFHPSSILCPKLDKPFR